jgi:hypothetical protein
MVFSPGSLRNGLFLDALLSPLLIGRMDDFVWEESLFFQDFSPNFGHCEGRELSYSGQQGEGVRKLSAVRHQPSAEAPSSTPLGWKGWVLTTDC